MLTFPTRFILIPFGPVCPIHSFYDDLFMTTALSPSGTMGFYSNQCSSVKPEALSWQSRGLQSELVWVWSTELCIYRCDSPLLHLVAGLLSQSTVCTVPAIQQQQQRHPLGKKMDIICLPIPWRDRVSWCTVYAFNKMLNIQSSWFSFYVTAWNNYSW